MGAVQRKCRRVTLTLISSIGLGLVKQYALRDDLTVIATARDPSRMPEVETGKGSKVVVVTMDQARSGGCIEVRHFYIG